MIRARHTDGVRVIGRRKLFYADGGDPGTGRPPHVRAASGLAWQGRGGRRVLVAPQDDTSFLAVLEPPDGAVSAITLDHAPGGARVFDARSGKKALKMDLESIAALDDSRALIVGSGSHANRRRIVRLEGDATWIVPCDALYDALAARADFAGSELNVEGSTRLGDRFLLANRGNGAARGALRPVDAIGVLSLEALLAYLDGAAPAPALERVESFELGTLGGGRLGFTDLSASPDGTLWFLACAEQSPNAYDDGEVVGCAIGRIDLAAGTATLAPIFDEAGVPSTHKPEGLAIDAWDGRAGRAYVCVDADDPDAPSLLLTLALE